MGKFKPGDFVERAPWRQHSEVFPSPPRGHQVAVVEVVIESPRYGPAPPDTLLRWWDPATGKCGQTWESYLRLVAPEDG